ncbi:hypothetical protein Ga0074812_13223 [Parafrankia irregularis]|uniref:Uncharacterized protein n=1 Tax=Parafrankia irregularis TaxID=795642 RepID=A0A0S4QZD0_9ACTN|nr:MULTISPECIES: hypothetical protein [Parafrankia]MBE3202561.1 hypothetical protein [Parafrankia sp. CH37]CUU59818.1 hypothetical protein Ga0074812_13223 [Parafrankia irregularis]
MSNVKCALALMGGYVLGRTKKAKAAISLGMWLSGRNYHAKDILRDQVGRLTRSTDGEQLINQLKGPATEAGRRAAVAVYESQINRLSDTLAQRTERLTAALGGSEKLARDEGEAVRGAVEDVATSVVPGTGQNGDSGSPRRGDETSTTGQHEEGQHEEGQHEAGQDRGAGDGHDAADRRVPDRSGGRRRDALRGPRERTQASTGGGSR